MERTVSSSLGSLGTLRKSKQMAQLPLLYVLLRAPVCRIMDHYGLLCTNTNMLLNLVLKLMKKHYISY